MAGSAAMIAARRHPKVMLAMLAVPFIYKAFKPAVVSLLQQHQQHQQQTAGSGDDDDASVGSSGGPESSTQVDWERVFSRGAREARRSASAGSNDDRCIDWDCPRSVLGIKQTAQLSSVLIQRAFQREIMAHHPDHCDGEAGKMAATERTRAIVAAYNELRRQTGAA